MMRAYAIGLGAGTQVFMLLVGEIIIGPPATLARALLMGGAWTLNLAIAEWVIRRRPSRSVRPVRTTQVDREDAGLLPVPAPLEAG